MDFRRANPDNRRQIPHGRSMKILFDFLPIILFFGAFNLAKQQPADATAWLNQVLGGAAIDPAQAPILIATVVVILATVLQVAWVWLRHGKVDKMLWFSLAVVVIFGGMTLALRDENFIKWKPTIFYWGVAAAMLISTLVFRKNAIRSMLGEQIALPEPVWSRLSLAWMVFFGFMGALNLFVAFSFPLDVWVSFKLFGGLGLLFVFVVAQAIYLSRHIEEK